MNANGPAKPTSRPWGDKRRAQRVEVAGSATADFLTPAGLRIVNLSREGIGLSGVVRIGARDTGVVTLYLPGSEQPTTVVASVAWSDRKGRVGLKFIEFRTIASEWQTWFTTTPAEEERGATEDETAVPTKVSAELAAAWRDVALDLRTDLQQRAAREWRIGPWLWRGLRVGAVAVVMSAAVGATLWWWQNRYHQAEPATLLNAPLPAAQAPAVKQQAAAPVVTAVRVVEGKPSLATPPKHGKAPEIERGKVIYRPLVRYTGFPLPVGEQVVELVLTIGQKGTVGYVTVVSGEPALARDALSTLGRWRYTPFLADSVPVSVNQPVTAIFRTTRVAAPDKRHPPGKPRTGVPFRSTTEP